ncbi:MAG: PExPT-CTERM protein [Terracidiphilus sp.]|jgi:XrtJ-associated TM-motif-TM protein
MVGRRYFLLALMLVTAAFPLFAQGGCIDSPEDPTIALALVGGIGGLAMSLGVARRRKK